MAWQTLCKPRLDGGLGMKNLHVVNRALIMKLAWGMISKPNAFWVRLLKSKYRCDEGTIPMVTPRTHNSLIWKGICTVWNDTLEGIRWIVRNGWQVQFWEDR